MFLRRTVNSLRPAAKLPFAVSGARAFSIDFEPIPDKYLNDPLDETAWSALAKSCYAKINWKVSENTSVEEAIKRMGVHKIGALAVTKGDGGEVVGIISERDYLNKIGVLGRNAKETTVGEICTYGRANLVSVTIGNPIDKCQRKMLNSDVRHLLVREKETGSIVGMISIKDIVKCSIAKHDAVVEKLTGMVVNSEAMRSDV